jgi:hypothetical protein
MASVLAPIYFCLYSDPPPFAIFSGGSLIFSFYQQQLASRLPIQLSRQPKARFPRLTTVSRMM